jgi:serine phosphatase RsbU (regulator of sigma subunit)
LISDVTIDEDYKGQQSIASSLRTALVVPLAGSDGKPVGMIQLDSRANKEGFTAAELDQLAAVAVPLGVAVENDTLLKKRASWAAAGEIQRALLPKRRPDIAGYTFWECYRPVDEVGGDLYDYIPFASFGKPGSGETRWGVIVGDVAGHGMPAALMMAGTCPLVRHLVRAGLVPEEVVTKVSREVWEAEFDCRFVTLLLAELDPRSNRLTIANAGQMLPLIRRSSGTIEEVGGDASGIPLGVDPDAVYRSFTVSLEPGDVVVLYTDGGPDARDRKDQRFGEERFIAALAQAPQGVAAVGEAILATLHEYASGRSQFDDITLVCFGRNIA